MERKGERGDIREMENRGTIRKRRARRCWEKKALREREREMREGHHHHPHPSTEEELAHEGVVDGIAQHSTRRIHAAEGGAEGGGAAVMWTGWDEEGGKAEEALVKRRLLRSWEVEGGGWGLGAWGEVQRWWRLRVGGGVGS